MKYTHNNKVVTNPSFLSGRQGNPIKKPASSFILLLLGTALLLGGVNPAQAVVILPISATASSENASRTALSAVNGSGLSGGQHTNGPDVGKMWLNGIELLSVAWFKIDLGGTFTVDSLHVWNYNETQGAGVNRGFQTADIWSSSTGTGTPTTNPGDWQLVTNDQAFAQAPGTSTYTGESVSMGGVATNFILFDDLTNYGTAFSANQVGLSEVQVLGNVVPEPSRLLLSLLGIAAMILPRRRR